MRIPPPPPTRVEPIEETLHGVRVVDPYRWLEDSDSAETRAWTDAQNAHTRASLDRLPFRERLAARITELWSIGLLETPRAHRGRYFFRRRGPEHDQAVLYLRRGPHGGDEVVVDPNALAAEKLVPGERGFDARPAGEPDRPATGLVSLDWWFPSADGRLVAYGLSHGGDEQSTLHVVEVDTARVLEDRIPHTRHATVAWLRDGSGFYYTRYPAPGTVPPGEERYRKHVRVHHLGDDPAADPVVHEPREPTDFPTVSLSPDGRWLLVHMHHGWAKTSVHVLDRERPGAGFRAIGEDLDAIFNASVADGRLYLHTNWEAPNWRLLALDPTDLEKEAAPPGEGGGPARANAASPSGFASPSRSRSSVDLARAATLISERPDVVLRDVRLAGGAIAAHELADASSRLRIYAPDGALLREVPLPGLGSLESSFPDTPLWGRWDEPDLLFTFQSFTTPPVAFRHEVRSGETEEFARLPDPPGLHSEPYEVRQVRCVSRDGTAVPVFLVHRRGLRADGSNPTVLLGYGGFNVDLTPFYISTLPLWVESGGVYAVAVLRGGGEFGEAWHRAGMLANKQNVFDDFIAAADWLVRERYTSRERLAIWGGSNGGLLVGAALTQRPDLCRAAVSAVPLLDLLRYHHFQIAKLWIAEYGSADDPEEFRWLHAYSPYHRVLQGERYPAVFLTTALGDTRVDPMHARKMAALLQAASASRLPVLLRIETAAGHGQGKPRWKQVEEFTDTWSFVFWQLGVEV